MKNKKIFLSFFILLLLVACSNIKTQDSDAEKCTLKNRYLELNFIPGSMGRLSSIKYRPSCFEMLIPYETETAKENPLFSPSKDNSRGIRELYWGLSLMGAMTPMQIEKKDSETLIFYSPCYGNTESSLHRKVCLDDNSTCISFETEIQNRSNKTALYSLWFNIVPACNEGFTPVIPSKGGNVTVNKRKYFWSEDDSLLGGGNNLETFVSPARPWIAFAMPSEKLVLAFSSSQEALGGDGFFYSWQGLSNGKNIKTIEIIMNGGELPPDAKKTYTYSLLIFPGLTSIKEICSDTGIDASVAEDDGKIKVTVSLSPAKNMLPERFEIYFKDLDGTKIDGSFFDLQELPPGKVKELNFEVPVKKFKTGTYSICGDWGRYGKFELISPKINIK